MYCIKNIVTFSTTIYKIVHLFAPMPHNFFLKFEKNVKQSVDVTHTIYIKELCFTYKGKTNVWQ